MQVKWITFIVSLLLIVTLLVGCMPQTSNNDDTHTTTLPPAGTTAADTPLAGQPTADCVRTTPVGFVAPNTTVSGSVSQTTVSSSDSAEQTSSSNNTSNPTTVPPTVHTLTAIPETAYYGLTKLNSMPNATALAATYHKLVQAVTNTQSVVSLDKTLTADQLLTVFCYYRADYPQHFWCDGNVQYTTVGGKVSQVTLQYSMTGDALRKAQTDFTRKVIDLLKIAATGDNEYERERLLHDALAKRVTYRDGKNAHNAYGALVEGKAVCEGYARAFQYILYQSGIQCLIAEGSSINPSTGLAEAHAWNVVYIGGQYYHVDLTWDDTDDVQTPVMYPYFNVTTSQINEDHTIRTENGYPLPNCIATQANYHVRNRSRLTVYTVDGVAALFKGKPGSVHVYATEGGEAFIGWFRNNYRSIAKAIGINGGYSYSLLCIGNEVVVRFTVT